MDTGKNPSPSNTGMFSKTLKIAASAVSGLNPISDPSMNTTSQVSDSDGALADGAPRMVRLTEDEMLAIAGVPPMYRAMAKDPINDRAGHIRIMELAVMFEAAPRLVYIHGGVGTGKTHMGTWLWWMLYKTKVELYHVRPRPSQFVPQARWVSGYQFAQEMKAYSRDGFSVLDQLHDYTRAQMECLIVDDIFADRATDTDYANLTQLVEMRRNMLYQHTVLTGNLNLMQITERSERLADRLAGEVVVYFDGGSWRLRMAK